MTILSKISYAYDRIVPLALPDHRLQVLSGAEIGAFGEAANLLLSPHFDDICFSLGAFVRRVRSGTMVNIFTRGSHVPIDAETPRSVEAVHALRDREDEGFARMVGLRRIDLRLEEPSLRRRGSRNLAGVEQDMGQIVRPLAEQIDRFRESFASVPRNLFCPAGVGNHANHVAVARFVIERHAALASDFRIFFYEEFPYILSPRWRRIGVKRLLRSFPGIRGNRLAIPIGDLEAKRELVGCYPSQLAPADFGRFWRSSPQCPEPHEALWEFARSPRDD